MVPRVLDDGVGASIIDAEWSVMVSIYRMKNHTQGTSETKRHESRYIGGILHARELLCELTELLQLKSGGGTGRFARSKFKTKVGRSVTNRKAGYICCI